MVSIKVTEKIDGKPKRIFDIVEPTFDKAFATYFSKYVNRYKYCSSINFNLDDTSTKAAYNVWMGDIKNYANNGGDMW